MSDKLYLMKAGDYYKIGVSKTPDKRARTLQTGCPHKIDILHEISIEDAYKVEFLLHGLYKKNRTHGEWFIGINQHQFLRAVRSYEHYTLEESEDAEFVEYFTDTDDPYTPLYFDIRYNGKITTSADFLENEDLICAVNNGIKHFLEHHK